MDDPLLILGVIVGVALLILGGRIRRRSLQRPRRKDAGRDASDEPAPAPSRLPAPAK